MHCLTKKNKTINDQETPNKTFGLLFTSISICLTHHAMSIYILYLFFLFTLPQEVMTLGFYVVYKAVNS